MLGHFQEKDILSTMLGIRTSQRAQDHWLRSPKRKELFGPLGVTNIRTFVDSQMASSSRATRLLGSLIVSDPSV
jgi:hypothetical protein